MFLKRILQNLLLYRISYKMMNSGQYLTRALESYFWAVLSIIAFLTPQAFGAFTPGNTSGYVLAANHQSTNPAKSTTYYFGANYIVAATTTADLYKIYIPKTGTIKAAYINVYVGTTLAVGGGNSTINISYGGSDTAISSVVTHNAISQYFSNTALSVAVTAGNYLEIKWATPTGGGDWSTPPAGVRTNVYMYIE